MSKLTPFLFFIILILSTSPLLQANALGVGPPYSEFDLLPDGSKSTTFYVTSDGLNGMLIVGRDDLPFRVEPSSIEMSSGDVSVPVELTFYGNETLETGVYVGLVTFTADTGGFIGYRIRLWVTINLLDDATEPEPVPEPEPVSVPDSETQEEEPETPVEEEPVPVPESEAQEEKPPTVTVVEEPEPEPVPDSETQEEKTLTVTVVEELESEMETEPESEEEPEPESQDIEFTPYIMGGAVVAALALIAWWMKK